MPLLYAIGIALLTVVVAYLVTKSVSGARSTELAEDSRDDLALHELSIQRAIDMEVAEALVAEAMMTRDIVSAEVPDNVTELADYQSRRPPEGRTVKLSPPRPAIGREATIRYKGELSHAESLFLRLGYGFGDWDGVSDVPMTNEGGVWKASFKVSGISRLSVCFHDGAGNWDNNSGQNWSWDVLL